MNASPSGSRRGFAAAFAAIVVSLTGCGLTGPGLREGDEVARNQALWNQVRPADYHYTVGRNCFCPPGFLGPVRVTVLDENVVSRVYVDSGEDVPAEVAEHFPTVDGLFDFIRDAYAQDAFRIEVEYDTQTGVPVSIFVDYIENAIDEEQGFTVTALPEPI